MPKKRKKTKSVENIKKKSELNALNKDDLIEELEKFPGVSKVSPKTKKDTKKDKFIERLWKELKKKKAAEQLDAPPPEGGGGGAAGTVVDAPQDLAPAVASVSPSKAPAPVIAAASSPPVAQEETRKGSVKSPQSTRGQLDLPVQDSHAGTLGSGSLPSLSEMKPQPTVKSKRKELSSSSSSSHYPLRRKKKKKKETEKKKTEKKTEKREKKDEPYKLSKDWKRQREKAEELEKKKKKEEDKLRDPPASSSSFSDEEEFVVPEASRRTFGPERGPPEIEPVRKGVEKIDLSPSTSPVSMESSSSESSPKYKLPNFPPSTFINDGRIKDRWGIIRGGGFQIPPRNLFYPVIFVIPPEVVSLKEFDTSSNFSKKMQKNHLGNDEDHSIFTLMQLGYPGGFNKKLNVLSYLGKGKINLQTDFHNFMPNYSVGWLELYENDSKKKYTILVSEFLSYLLRPEGQYVFDEKCALLLYADAGEGSQGYYFIVVKSDNDIIFCIREDKDDEDEDDIEFKRLTNEKDISTFLDPFIRFKLLTYDHRTGDHNPFQFVVHNGYPIVAPYGFGPPPPPNYFTDLKAKKTKKKQPKKTMQKYY